MKALLLLLGAILLNSCCSPYYSSYINPLFLEEDGYEKSCILRPCDLNENCKPYIPWLNLEYEIANQHFLKYGATFFGYSNIGLINLTGNFIRRTHDNSTNDKINGFGLETQLGTLKLNKYYTSFIGLEYNHFFQTKNYNQFHPTIGFAIPFKYINSFQFKGGYQFNTAGESNYWTAGINFKMPLYFLY